MSGQLSEETRCAQVNLGETPNVQITGSQTGSSLEIRYISPHREASVSPTQPSQSLPSEHPEPRGLLTPEQKVGVQIVSLNLYNVAGDLYDITGDGNIIGDGSQSRVTKSEYNSVI